MGLTCSDQDSTVDVVSRTATIRVDPGENVVCVFNNVAAEGVVIEKVTVPALASGVFTFSQNLDGSDNFQLTGGGHKGFATILSGTVSEEDPTPGFDLTSIICNAVIDDTNYDVATDLSKVDFTYAAGETVHCAFTNTQRGRIIVDKVTEPAGDAQSFDFVLVGGPVDDIVNQSFALTDAAAPYDSDQIKPGTYSLAETPMVAGWDLSSAQCSDGSTPSNITLDPGETVTCTFTNTKHTSLTVAVTEKSAGSGTVASNPPGIDCDDSCTAEFYKFPWPTFVPATKGAGKK